MVEYRKAKTEDFKDICELVKSKSELFWIYPSGRFPLTIAQIEKLSRERRELTVVTANEKVIGFANLYNYRKGESAFIGNIVIEESFRGRGLGRKLVLHMLDKAYKNHNLKEVHISVFSDNRCALSLYSSLGFQPYDMEERQSPSGSSVTLIHMKTGVEQDES